jgi:hypothetical protein
MNRLPADRQNDIWEYVRGDQAHWKQEFRCVIVELGSQVPTCHLEECRKLRSSNAFRKYRKLAYFDDIKRVFHKPMIGPMSIVKFRRPGDEIEYWTVEDVCLRFRKLYPTFEEARASYRNQVRIAASRVRDSS